MFSSVRHMFAPAATRTPDITDGDGQRPHDSLTGSSALVALAAGNLTGRAPGQDAVVDLRQMRHEGRRARRMATLSTIAGRRCRSGLSAFGVGIGYAGHWPKARLA